MIASSDAKVEVVERPRNLIFRSIIPIGTLVEAEFKADGVVVEQHRYQPTEPVAEGNVLRCIITIDYVEDKAAPGEPGGPALIP